MVRNPLCGKAYFLSVLWNYNSCSDLSTLIDWFTFINICFSTLTGDSHFNAIKYDLFTCLPCAAEQSTSSGFLIEDRFAFPDDGQPVNLVFGCEDDETGEIFRQEADGIMGMGNTNNAFQSQVSSWIITEIMPGILFCNQELIYQLLHYFPAACPPEGDRGHFWAVLWVPARRRDAPW